jgi:hypothetical protein
MLNVQQKHKSTSIIISVHSGALELSLYEIVQLITTNDLKTIPEWRLDWEYLQILPVTEIVAPTYATSKPCPISCTVNQKHRRYYNTGSTRYPHNMPFSDNRSDTQGSPKILDCILHYIQKCSSQHMELPKISGRISITRSTEILVLTNTSSKEAIQQLSLGPLRLGTTEGPQ